MKALILAGGYAKRLWPVTLYKAKALLQVGRKPILTYIFEAVQRVAGIDQIYISTNKRFAADFRTWLAKTKLALPVKLIIEPTQAEEQKFGAIKGIQHAIQSQHISDDLLIVAGDNLFDFDLNELVAFYKARARPVIALYDVRSRERARLYGVVNLHSTGRITEFIEKPVEPASTLISTAIYIIPKALLAKFREYIESGGLPDAPGYFLQWLVNRADVHGMAIHGHWFDVGDRASLAAARRWARSSAK